MTKLHYLIMRNAGRISLGEMSPEVLRVFTKYGNGLRFRATAFTRCPHWINVSGFSPDLAERSPAYRELVYSIYDTYRPKGLRASEDPDPPLVLRGPDERHFR